ncbi:late competence development ComFB family protein [Massilibacterium senegalense]|uniref:late competence development ComFB family protein n=1 Tax=Massilibacterium senegalense TaxID=1632858 RepID=UPI00164ED5D5|nr:late competence development ComFB family protein [Massilibacterium senegalense]
MEILAKNYLHENISELGLKFPCEKCKNDVLAFALNRLEPKYVSNVRGHAFVKAQMMTDQYKTDIICALTNAVQVVNNNPDCSFCEYEECPKSSSS